MRFKIFDCYFLDINPDTHRISIVSVKRRVEKTLRPTIKSGMSYYRLYFNGNFKDLSLESIVSKVEFHIKPGHLSDNDRNFINEAI